MVSRDRSIGVILTSLLVACGDDLGGEGSTGDASASASASASATGASAGTTEMGTSTTSTSGGTQGTTTTSTSGGESDTNELPACGADGRFFPRDSIWYRDHARAAVHPNSATIVAWLEDAGWGGGDEMRIDFSIEVLEADNRTPRVDFVETDEFYSPDCDHVPMPIPAGGALEGEDGYTCDNDGDCHLIVIERDECMLYEMWRADYDGETFNGGCLALWDMSVTYGDEGRGDGCTSADAAGFPIAPLLFSADEVAAGSIDHAIRFVLPNDNIRHFVYVAPATHSTNPTAGPAEAPPYGVHLRLRPDFPLESLPSEGARVVARALQRYGMFLADGGQITLTARSDRFTANKWAGLLDAYDLATIRPSDFDVIDHGPDKTWDSDLCARTPIVR